MDLPLSGISLIRVTPLHRQIWISPGGLQQCLEETQSGQVGLPAVFSLLGGVSLYSKALIMCTVIGQQGVVYTGGSIYSTYLTDRIKFRSAATFPQNTSFSSQVWTLPVSFTPFSHSRSTNKKAVTWVERSTCPSLHPPQPAGTKPTLPNKTEIYIDRGVITNCRGPNGDNTWRGQRRGTTDKSPSTLWKQRIMGEGVEVGQWQIYPPVWESPLSLFPGVIELLDGWPLFWMEHKSSQCCNHCR